MILGLAVAVVLILGAGAAHAQLGIGQPANVRSIDVTIEDLDQISVVHEVSRGGSARYVELIEGTVSDIEVVDDEGREVQHGVSEGFGGTTVAIFSGGEAFVKYTLSDVMHTKHDTTWSWPFLYTSTVTFHFPESVDLVFVNETPVYFEGARSFNCHGCSADLEFVPGEGRTAETATWDEREFEVEVWASTEIESFRFDQPSKSISYSFDDTERWVTLIIPQELLWGPYQASFNGEKIFTHVFELDEGRHGVSLKLDGAGTASITGASVVPEFPLVLPVLAVAVSAAILLRHRGVLSLR
ncbi:hypothetical protein CENSYa_1437 [Cenarchaeum symbiosum A]|uniref:Uncharacterized protein n=1 Tax=Cenarchaeum symbiosum (strain A) TaxID=414004 RepID=A0RXJ2_CENSY|nr:hypothetical protein CENSYa_1437 [Cenarchaeum symbiosum A]